MISRLPDFDVEMLTDGKVNFFFPCGHSVIGEKVVGKDLLHKCEERVMEEGE